MFIHGRNLIFADENILRKFTFVSEFINKTFINDKCVNVPV